MDKKTIFINLFGGPCTGKSTLCALIFANLKKEGIDCEMALEYVKDLVWEESFKKIENQLYIFGKQHNRLFRLSKKVDVVITDSPLLNSIVYYNGDNPIFEDCVMFEFKKLNSINYYLNRTFDYIDSGRMQNIEEANSVDIKYKNLLDRNNIEYEIINFNDSNISNITNDIILKMNNDK